MRAFATLCPVALLVGLLTGLSACGDDGGSASGTDATDAADSGFTGGATTAATTAGTGSDDGIDTWGEGELRGILTFTFYPDDPVTASDFVGMAGAWRDVSVGFEDVDDFFAVYGLQANFPPPPEGEDELVQNEVPPPFDWGEPEDWILAGNGMKLVSGDTDALACLLLVGGEYPVYVSTDSSLQPEGCQPDVADWMPDTRYDLVVYGGDRFETNVLTQEVHTPPALDVSAPDISRFNLQVPIDQDLEIAWSDNGNPSNRLIIRMSDMFGRMFTVHAVDDGSYDIPASAMAALAPGPVTLTIAREQIDAVPFTHGGVKVVTRYEHWGYLELF